MRLLLALSMIAMSLAGCAGESGTDAVVDDAAPEPFYTAVIGLQDNGINVYHRQFRDDSPLAQQHPSTYIPGYPEDAKPLKVSLDAPDYWSAVKADCETVWSTIELGQLYYVPGTKIIGAITLAPFSPPDCSEDEPYVPAILASSHGTMTASRAAGTEYGACKACRIVMVEGFNVEGVEWLGQNAGWIDAESHSWGPVVPGYSGPVSTGLLTADSALVRAVEEAASKHLAFWAAGNGAAFRFGVVGHPTQAAPHMGPSVIIVGGHDSGRVTLWPGFTPHVIADACNSWAAHHTDMESSGDDVGGGTSGATPFAAGGALEILLQARILLGDTSTGVEDGIVARGEPGDITDGPLADGEFTLQEWRDVAFKTATPRPERQAEDGAYCSELPPYNTYPVEWTMVPEEVPAFLYVGYGALDNASVALANEVIRGATPLPDRTGEDAYFAADREARGQLNDAFGTP